MDLHDEQSATVAPSTLLARALTVMEQFLKANPARQAELVEVAEAARNSVDSVWELEADDLYTGGKLNADSLFNLDDPRSIARGIGILDAWHRFANPDQTGFTEAMQPAAAFQAEGRLERDGRLNENIGTGDGHLIPGRCIGVTQRAPDINKPLSNHYRAYIDASILAGYNPKHYDHLPAGETPVGANQLLRNTSWLPETIPCGHPDSRWEALREVNTSYVAVGPTHKSAPLPLDEPLRVAVVPLAETRACVNVVVTNAGSRYLVAPAFSIERVNAAIHRAFSDDTQILLFPEMTIDSRWLPEIAAAVKGLKRQQRTSRLRYIMLGATCAPMEDTQGENFVAIIDGEGKLIRSRKTKALVRQDKICRWNLSRCDQRRFGFDRYRSPDDPLAPIVFESIEEARTVFVFDIVGFGRLICLICASLDHNQPSDWLVQHTQPDWVYAPVMDSSTAWTSSMKSPLEKWTLKRAIRAACLSRGKVVVSNSMALQQFENEELAYTDNINHMPKKPNSHVPNDHPGVALMIDGSGDVLQFKMLSARIPVAADDTAPISVSAEWLVDWVPLPLSL